MMGIESVIGCNMRFFIFLGVALALPQTAHAEGPQKDGPATIASATWGSCVRTTATYFAARTSENADILADAALGICRKDEVALSLALSDAIGPRNVDQAMDRQQRDMRKEAIAAIVNARIAQVKLPIKR
jgi:hypothetical protein